MKWKRKNRATLALSLFLGLSLMTLSACDKGSSDKKIGNGRSNLNDPNKTAEPGKTEPAVTTPTPDKSGEHGTTTKTLEVVKTERKGATLTVQKSAKNTGMNKLTEIKFQRHEDLRSHNAIQNVRDNESPMVVRRNAYPTPLDNCGQIDSSSHGLGRTRNCDESHKITEVPESDVPVRLPPVVITQGPEQPVSESVTQAPAPSAEKPKQTVEKLSTTPVKKTVLIEITQPYIKSASNELDVIFIVDSQKLLREKRMQIGKDFLSFLQNIDKNVSVNVAVIPGHSPQGIKMSSHGVPFNEEEPYKYDTHPKVLSRITDGGIGAYNDKELAAELQDRMGRIPPDPSASGGQLLLASLNTAMKNVKNLRVGKNVIMRPFAALMIVFVSNENDLCYKYKKGEYRNYPTYEIEQNEITAYLEHCLNKGISHESVMTAVKRANGDNPLMVASITYLEDGQGSGQSEKGRGLMDATINPYSSHHAASIGNATFNDDFKNMAQEMTAEMNSDITGLINTVPLKLADNEVVAKVEVNLDGHSFILAEDKFNVLENTKGQLFLQISAEYVGKEGSQLQITVHTEETVTDEGETQ